MAEISDVVPGQDVLAVWGNEVRDRSVMRYTTQAALETAEPSAPDGSLRWTDDNGLLLRQAGAWEKLGNAIYDSTGLPMAFPLSDSIFQVSIAGAEALIVGAGGVRGPDGGWRIAQVGDGSAAAPTYSWDDARGSGMFLLGADNVCLSVGGTQKVQISATQFIVPNVYTDATSLADGIVTVASNGRMRRSTTAVVAVDEAEVAAIEARLSGTYAGIIGELLDRIEALEA